MSQKVRHVLGISGGKDSAALAIYLRKKYTRDQLPIEYYTCDTGRELDETYKLINQLEDELSVKIKKYTSVDHEAVGFQSPFDYFIERYRNYLPSQNARWCTKNMKLEPFEKEVGEDPIISYVGIRGDEQREGYISTKLNIQSIFPFRKNIWSLDVTVLVLSNRNINQLVDIYTIQTSGFENQEEIVSVAERQIDKTFQMKMKLDLLLSFGVSLFNKVVFEFLKSTDYPVGKLEQFPLVDNEDIIVRKDVFEIIEKSNVDLPEYYLPIEYDVDGEKGKYFRSRSGCFFCFYQQKIEWVWLLEQHEDLFWEAESYEKDGYTWIQGESLKDLAKEERIKTIKREHLNRMKQKYINLVQDTDWQDQILGIKSIQPLDLIKDKSWLDTIIDAEEDMCANCFI
jgi:hypothetical protein